MSRKILNLTQHVASKEQISAGVFEPADKKEIQKFLTFEELPDRHEIYKRAVRLSLIAEKELKNKGKRYAMIGGAPFLMSTLEDFLRVRNIIPLYAFSRRIVKEEGDKKVSLFKHEGFVQPDVCPF